MRIILAAFISSALLLLTACQKQETTTLIDSNGQPVNLLQHPNRWLIINYWALWCAPCKKELGELNQFYTAHRDTVLMYGVEYDHPDLKHLQEITQRMGIDYPQLVTDPAKLLKLGDIAGLPTTFVFRPDGSFYKRLDGPQTVASLEAVLTAANIKNNA
jgi:thiol-disulfide isomerase/thioredoxin